MHSGQTPKLLPKSVAVLPQTPQIKPVLPTSFQLVINI
jgi:hypothetical protein